ncbi:Hypothetical protein SCLAV_2775, partial [Streptomyces clavuligerus]
MGPRKLEPPEVGAPEVGAPEVGAPEVGALPSGRRAATVALRPGDRRRRRTGEGRRMAGRPPGRSGTRTAGHQGEGAGGRPGRRAEGRRATVDGPPVAGSGGRSGAVRASGRQGIRASGDQRHADQLAQMPDPGRRHLGEPGRDDPRQGLVTDPVGRVQGHFRQRPLRRVVQPRAALRERDVQPVAVPRHLGHARRERSHVRVVGELQRPPVVLQRHMDADRLRLRRRRPEGRPVQLLVAAEPRRRRVRLGDVVVGRAAVLPAGRRDRRRDHQPPVREELGPGRPAEAGLDREGRPFGDGDRTGQLGPPQMDPGEGGVEEGAHHGVPRLLRQQLRRGDGGQREVALPEAVGAGGGDTVGARQDQPQLTAFGPGGAGVPDLPLQEHLPGEGARPRGVAGPVRGPREIPGAGQGPDVAGVVDALPLAERALVHRVGELAQRGAVGLPHAAPGRLLPEQHGHIGVEGGGQLQQGADGQLPPVLLGLLDRRVRESGRLGQALLGQVGAPEVLDPLTVGQVGPQIAAHVHLGGLSRGARGGVTGPGPVARPGP